MKHKVDHILGIMLILGILILTLTVIAAGVVTIVKAFTGYDGVIAWILLLELVNMIILGIGYKIFKIGYNNKDRNDRCTEP